MSSLHWTGQAWISTFPLLIGCYKGPHLGIFSLSPLPSSFLFLYPVLLGSCLSQSLIYLLNRGLCICYFPGEFPGCSHLLLVKAFLTGQRESTTLVSLLPATPPTEGRELWKTERLQFRRDEEPEETPIHERFQQILGRQGRWRRTPDWTYSLNRLEGGAHNEGGLTTRAQWLLDYSSRLMSNRCVGGRGTGLLQRNKIKWHHISLPRNQQTHSHFGDTVRFNLPFST